MKTLFLTLCTIAALSGSAFAQPQSQTRAQAGFVSLGDYANVGKTQEQEDDFALEQDQCLWYALAFAEHHHGSWLLFFDQPGQHQGHAMVFWQAPGMKDRGYVYDNMHPTPIIVNPSENPLNWIFQLYPDAYYTEFVAFIDFDHMTTQQRVFLQNMARRQLAAG